MPSSKLQGTVPSPDGAGSTPVYFLNFSSPFQVADAKLLPPDMLAFPSRMRDGILRSTIYHETGWSNALNIAMTQVASKAFEVTGDVPIHVKRSQELLLNSEGGEGWIDLLLKALLDYSTTDNGLFIEIERETKSPLSKVTGLWVLDSLRCYRTGNPEYPVVYTDIDGANHSLAQHQVIAIADTPQSNPRWRGIGLCAASRCYKSILLMIAIERYFYEKITGQRPLGIHFVSGMSDKQLEAAVEHAKNQNYAKGVQQYQGALVVALMGDTEPKIATVDFASLPDRFDRAYEVSLANRRFASALGFSVDELEPQTGNALGTGAQAQVQFRRDQRKGLAALEPRLIHQLHQKVLPKSVTYSFVSRDLDDSLKEADLKSKQIAGYIPAVEKQVITPLQALQQLVEEKVFPKTFLAGQSELQDRSLTDTERSEDLNSSSNSNTSDDDTTTATTTTTPSQLPAQPSSPIAATNNPTTTTGTGAPAIIADPNNQPLPAPANLVVIGNDDGDTAESESEPKPKNATRTKTEKAMVAADEVIDNPGARGGKYYYDENNQVQYGEPPKPNVVDNKTLTEGVKLELLNAFTPESMLVKGWTPTPSRTGEYHSSLDAAKAVAIPMATQYPNNTVVVKTTPNGYIVASQPTQQKYQNKTVNGRKIQTVTNTPSPTTTTTAKPKQQQPEKVTKTETKPVATSKKPPLQPNINSLSRQATSSSAVVGSGTGTGNHARVGFISDDSGGLTTKPSLSPRVRVRDEQGGPTSKSSSPAQAQAQAPSRAKAKVQPQSQAQASDYGITKSVEPSQYQNRGNISPIKTRSKKERIGKKRMALTSASKPSNNNVVVKPETKDIIAQEYPKALNLVEKFKGWGFDGPDNPDNDGVTLKHGHHDQSTHGRRHLGGCC